VTFILPALHAALVDSGRQETAASEDFNVNALKLLRTLSNPRLLNLKADDSCMIVEEVPAESIDVSMAGTHQRVPTIVANRIPFIGLRRIQNICRSL
jgi:hypothetical protein